MFDPQADRDNMAWTEVPIGVTGEIYIGGDGVALGYLNRPNLNQEKFIPDPFRPTSDAKLYRTGDLGKYLPNGKIVMIGRADTQVKVRGHRIELGEIETLLSEHPDIHEGAVIAPLDSKTGTRRLAAYIVPKSDADLTTTRLRQWLVGKLPYHMVPSTLTLMDALPLTPNYKTDRRALPVPTLDLETEIIPPATEVEAQLVQIWSEVLGIKVGVSQNFYECGGDSLRTALLLNHIRERFGIQVPLEYLFTAPTVADFAPILEMLKISDSIVAEQMSPQQLLAEAELPTDICPKDPVKSSFDRVFLTGATGFIGAFLLRELLNRYPHARIYCLVRAKSLEAAAERLQNVMQRYEIWDDTLGERVIPTIGDLEKPNFGMDESHFLKLARQIDVIYHSGAYVNLLYPYSALRSANVGGTLEVLRFATVDRSITLHYISTIDVFNSEYYNGHSSILETDELANATGYFEGYAQSKWVAEKLVMAARDRGLPTVIYRLGMITGHSKTGGSHLDNIICRMIKGFIQMGKAPDLDIGMVLAPVNYVAEAMSALSKHPEVIGQTFHIVSPHRLKFKQFIAEINSTGYQVEMPPYDTWYNQLLEQLSDNALTPILPMFTNIDKIGATPIETGTFVAQTHDTGNMKYYLKDHDIQCPAITLTTIQNYIQYFSRQGFLHLPSSPSTLLRRFTHH